MRMLFGAVMAVLGGLGVAWAETGIDASVETQAKPWTSLNLNNASEVFRFAVVSDNACGPRAGIFAEAVAKLNLMQPEFVIGTGDLIEGYEDNREGLEKQWDHFMSELGKLEVPYFFVPGNHDNGRPLWSEIYNARFGRPYYHFVYKDVLFLCLATNDGPEQNTGISKDQVEYAKKVLDEHPKVRWTFVFQHKPLWNESGSPEWQEIEAALKGRKCTLFSGHTHNYLSLEKDGLSCITLSTTGGENSLLGPAVGEFDQMAWVTMTKDGPRIANLALDGIFDKDFRTPERAKGLMAFNMNRAVTVAPIRLETGRLETASARLTISNPMKTPLRIKILSEAPAGVRVEPATVVTIVPAEGRYEADLKITADLPVPAERVQPIVLHWKASYDTTDNAPSLDLNGETRVLFDAPCVVPVARQAPVIDGKLNDWKDLPYVVDQPPYVSSNPSAWKGTQDGSFRFGVCCDGQYLYVAVAATDDQACFAGWKYWADFAMLYLDARLSDQEDAKSAAFSVLAGPQLTDEQKKEYQEGTVPEGVKSASAPVDGGFAAEFAIPVAFLNEKQGGAWQRLHLNVAFSDFDTQDARDGVTILYWRPEWRGKQLPAFGSFTRAAGE